MSKVWVVYIDEMVDCDPNVYIAGVYASKERAEEAINDYANEVEKNYSLDNSRRDSLSFEMYDEGWYTETHFSAYAVEMEVKE